jgi:signal transduction histidine kinase
MSLRTRLFASYLLIVVLCLGLVALAVTLILQGQRDRLAIDRLNDMARPVYVQVLSLVRGQVSSDEFWRNLKEQAQNNNVFILLGNSDGNIINQVTPGQSPYQRIEVASGELPHGISELTQGTFTTSNGQAFLFVAYPLSKVPDGSQPPRVESLILAVPRGKAVTILAGFVRPFILAGMIALVISLIIAAILARSVYRHIRLVSEAAEGIAQGQYDQQVPVAGPREVRGLAASFNQMAEQVKKSQQELRHFVADVSHQLKTPLTSIQGFAQAMLDGMADDDETRLKAATIINDESKRMKCQVDELLELARMQSGQLEMAQEPIDVSELLQHCQEVFTMQAEEKDVAIKMEAEPQMIVVGDFDRLEQVFSNLLDNAIKNSPTKGEVGISGRKAGTNLIEIRVVDDGPGIPPEMLPHVFERFYQAGGVRTGVGLGLAIAKEIVLAHGGTIKAESSH